MKKLIIIFGCLIASCGSDPFATPSGDPNCKGTSGNTLSCSSGSSCSHTGGAGCSMVVDGVACCRGAGNTGSGDGTSNCALGYCWNSGNTCCPYAAQYYCYGGCYATNVCNWTSYVSACHQW